MSFALIKALKAEKKVNEIVAQMGQSNKQSQVLSHGVQVINANQNSVADFEIQGRTLTSLGNSNLLNGKKYVLTDKKTKVKVDNAYVTGVSKFTKGSILTTTGNFVGKVRGDNTVNPHYAKSGYTTTLNAPNLFSDENADSQYTQISKLDGIGRASTTTTNGQYAQQLFSFNLIEQVERNLGGRIPAKDTAGKVQWLKDNVSRIDCNWYGFGLSVGGNKASVSIWFNGSWLAGLSSTSSTVSKISRVLDTQANMNSSIQSDGFVHYLAHAEPSDGNVASTINTDYIECIIELKSSAQLDTRPQVVRVANFEGKVSGSTVEVPHVSKFTASSTLIPPSGSWMGETAGNFTYDRQMSLNGTSATVASSTNGLQAQALYSFDLISEIERNIGRIPRSTTDGKVQWLKDNVSKLTCNWWGFGSSVGGNKAVVYVWNVPSSLWNSWTVNSTGNATKLPNIVSDMVNRIDTNGYFHILAAAEPSNGSVASTINTDYVELEIELKPGADIHNPLIPLYEVDDTEYNNILVSWDESAVLNRYPRVIGTQHLNSPYVMAEGENLLPPFSEWALHGNATMKGPYELELNATGAFQGTDIKVRCMPNTQYTASFDINGYVNFSAFDINNNLISSIRGDSKTIPYTFTTPSNTYYVRVNLTNSNEVTKFTFKNPMLTLGTTPIPFTPRNPSYLFADVKLGQIGNVKDSLYKQDGQWFVRKVIEKDVELSGSLAWEYQSDGVGYKRVKIPTSTTTSTKGVVSKYNGYSLVNLYPVVSGDQFYHDSSLTYITISDSDTGFTESQTPSSDMIKAYFNGWRYTSDGSTHSWASIVDGSAPSTNTIDFVKANKAANYIPYKLSYVLATSQIINVTDKVEGEVVVNGVTQVEVGSGVIVREKVVPNKVGSANPEYHINSTDMPIPSILTKRVDKITNIYKNGRIDTNNWIFQVIGVANGKVRAYCKGADYDPTAEYTVTYLVLDRQSFTNNGTEIKAIYDTSLKSVVDTLVNRNADQETAIGVNVRAIAELYKRVKALGG